ncbi:MAG: hypothetical protein JO000_05685 [Alphaproteobacteria bacterium]|nr:hypothetical protein [Alphaproteobacteria bacterium]
MNHWRTNSGAPNIDDVVAAKRQAHRANLARYARLLVTELTQLERDYIHRRIREERIALEALEAGALVAAGATDAASSEVRAA